MKGKVEEYLEYLEKEEKSIATRKQYGRDVMSFLRFAGGAGVTKELVIRYKENLQKAYQPASVNTKIAAINGFFTFMGREDLRVKQLKIQRRAYCSKEKELTRAEYLRLIQAAESRNDGKLALMIQTICGTGIRVSELASITAEAVQSGEAVINLKGKTRSILIPGKLRKVLSAYTKRLNIVSGPVFITRTGRPVDQMCIRDSCIPESARYYEMKGDLDKAKKIVTDLEAKVMKKTGKELPPVPDAIAEIKDVSGKSKFAQLFQGVQAKRTLTMWILWFCVLFGHYGLNTWFSDLLVGKGFSVVKSNGFVILMYLPAIAGYLIATYLVEVFGRKKMIFTYMICAALFAYLYGGANSMTTIIVWGCLFQMFNFGIWSLIYTYASEVFPTRIRSTGCGTTSSSGRLAALIAPTLFGVIMQAGAPQIFIFVIAAIVFIIGAMTTLIFGTETKGKSVEEINEATLEQGK